MHRTFLASIISIAFVFAPFTASALTQDDIATQVQQLLAQIAALTMQLQNLTTSTSTPQVLAPMLMSQQDATSTEGTITCPAITRTLSSGMSGDEVLSLQHFLNDVRVLDSSYMTGYFGTKTEAAVKSWQLMQKIVTSGDAASTGFGVVGSKTRAAISSACGGALPKPNTIGAALSLTGSRTSLQATAVVTANTANACSAQSFSLDWGDGSDPVTIAVPAGKCAALQVTYAHTYQKAGGYTVTLGNDTSNVTAAVSVSQAPVCDAPQFALDTIPTGTLGAQYALTVISYPDASSTLTLVSTALPEGLSLLDVLSTSTGPLIHNWTISGTPTVATSTSVTISAHNDCGTSQATFIVPVATK